MSGHLPVNSHKGYKDNKPYRDHTCKTCPETDADPPKEFPLTGPPLTDTRGREARGRKERRKVRVEGPQRVHLTGEVGVGGDYLRTSKTSGADRGELSRN